MTTIIQAPTEHVRTLVQHIAPKTSEHALYSLRTSLLLALTYSMTNTQLYANPTTQLPASAEPEALAAACNPLVLTCAYHTLTELYGALGYGPGPDMQKAMVYADGWQDVAATSYPAAGALSVEFLPRTLTTAPPASSPEARPAPVPSGGVAAQFHPLPAIDLSVPGKASAGRPAKSAFDTKHPERQRVAKAPGWVYDLRETAERLFTGTAGELLASERTLGPIEAYATAVDLLNAALRRLDPNVTVGQLQEWLAGTLSAVDGSPAGPAAVHFVNQCWQRPDKTDKGGA